MIAIIKKPCENYRLTLVQNTLPAIREIIGDTYATDLISEAACFVYNPNAIKEMQRFNFSTGKRDYYGTVLICGVNYGCFANLPNVYQEAFEMLRTRGN